MIIKLLFGVREGILINISDHQQSQARKSNVRIHHFAHNNAICRIALETSIHLYAKEVLEKNKRCLMNNIITQRGKITCKKGD